MEEREDVSGGVDQGQSSSRVMSEKKGSKESWYGTFLLLVSGAAVVALLGITVWWAYAHLYLPRKQEKVSISNLTQETFQPYAKSGLEEVSSEGQEAETPKEETLDVKLESILILNGGGAKGSAGEVLDLLKKEGYKKASLGNTEKNYTGVVAYFAPQKEGVADEIKKTLLKRYPKMTSQGSMEDNKETTGASVVVIIGK